MLDKKEKQASIKPVNSYVAVRFVELNENKSKDGIIALEDNLQGKIIFKGDKIYLVEILAKADDCKDFLPSDGYALVNKLSGFGIPTVEDGYVKLVPETELLMTTQDKELAVENIDPQYFRALVKVTSDQEVTEDGIITEGASSNLPWASATLGGEIVKIGQEFNVNGENYQVGDKVRFDAYMGTDIFIEGEKFRMVLLNELICRITD